MFTVQYGIVQYSTLLYSGNLGAEAGGELDWYLEISNLSNVSWTVF